MKNNIRLMALLCCMLAAISTFAQNQVKGTVVDETNTTLIGVNVLVLGTQDGTATGLDGTFDLTTAQPLPFTLRVSYVGFQTQDIEVATADAVLRILLLPETTLLGEVLVQAPSRKLERFLETPVSILQMDRQMVENSSTFEVYDAINKLPGVHSNQASLTFNTINTRGFATGGNFRFVQLIDGMDNAAPILNFPTGNVVGISELDLEGAELVPGAASALYGPNAFNGVLSMKSKDPFKYQGLSAQVKYGITDSDAAGSDPLTSVGLRYAEAFNDRFAFKLDFNYLTATDWKANDYTTDRNLYADGIKGPHDPAAPNFDGMNTYGDETEIFVPINLLGDVLPPAICDGDPNCEALLAYNIPLLDPILITRTGFREEDLLKNRDAKSLKLSGALHYRINDDLEASYGYRYGKGSTVYQGSERYVLDGFTQQMHRLELKGNKFNVLGYLTQTDAGDSYNLTALGGFGNEALLQTSDDNPDNIDWIDIYLGNYVGALLEQTDVFGGEDFSDLDENELMIGHNFARAATDGLLPPVGSDQWKAAMDLIRSRTFNNGGASFIDDSRMYHVEANYDFSELLDNVVEAQVGANFRQYDLFTDGTVFAFIEDPDRDGKNERFQINEGGGYLQLSKRVLDDHLKLTGSVRYDKNQNFDGQFSPRLSAVYSVDDKKMHNVRASFQTAFRNPSTQDQYIFFQSLPINIGGTEENAGWTGLYEGNAWTQSSYDTYQGCRLDGGTHTQCAPLLKDADMDYVQPEKLTSYEVGYKGKINGKLLVDAHAYYSTYNDFIVERFVANKQDIKDNNDNLLIPSGTAWSAFTNADQEITSWGAVLALGYELSDQLLVNGNYAYATFDMDDPEGDFLTTFNTPEHRFNIGLTGNKILDNFGFGVNYRWQDEFYYESAFAQGMVASFGTIDAQINYHFPKVGTTIKLGATNLFGDDYMTNPGNPNIGRTYFIGLMYEGLK